VIHEWLHGLSRRITHDIGLLHGTGTKRSLKMGVRKDKRPEVFNSSGFQAMASKLQQIRILACARWFPAGFPQGFPQRWPMLRQGRCVGQETPVRTLFRWPLERALFSRKKPSRIYNIIPLIRHSKSLGGCQPLPLVRIIA
jgi:hypothetical protein